MARAVAPVACARSGVTGSDWHAQRSEQDFRGNRQQLRQVSRSSQQNQRGQLLPIGPLYALYPDYQVALADAVALMNTLQNEHQFGYVAVSLGYFDTLMSCPATSTSSEMPEDALEMAAIRPGLVRMAAGYTGTLEQRWAQLRTALEAVGLA